MSSSRKQLERMITVIKIDVIYPRFAYGEIGEAGAEPQRSSFLRLSRTLSPFMA